MFKESFIQAIHERRKVKLTFFSKEDRGELTRACAPMDYGPSRHSSKKDNRYHLWDYDSDSGSHTLSLPSEQIKNIEILKEQFHPAEFVTWPPNWFVQRNWGKFS
ncbi:MAG: hypothetical protein KAW12_20040 [Candidatus Aminicenantes bacterium]|nr:hypothetical protein [Candidatus Aminicenantes bacterium]